MTPGTSIRIDKWLWYARVVKTRTLAQKLVRAGKVRVDKLKIANPSVCVSAGNVLTIALERRILVYEILACGARRGPFAEAQTLYKDIAPPTVKSDSEGTDAQSREFTGNIQGKHSRQTRKLSPNERPDKRPDKRQRRQLLEIKQMGNTNPDL